MMTVPFYITCATIALLVLMGIYIGMAKNKRTLHFIFMMAIIEIFIWNGAAILQTLFMDNPQMYIVWENLTYIGSAGVPVTLLIMGRAYSQKAGQFKKWQLLLFVIPVLTQIMVWTNGYHGLFYQEYGMGVAPNVPGPYFWVHAVSSYIYLIGGIGYLIYNAIRNSGVWSIQAVLIIIGSIIPMVANVLYTLEVPGLDTYSTPIAFTSTLVLYLLGMFRFNLLRITPVALQTVINRISDSFIVVDANMMIIDYNKTFEDNFTYYTDLRKGANFHKILVAHGRSNIGADAFAQFTEQAVESGATLIKDIDIEGDGKKQFYTVEFTPIQQGRRTTSAVLLFKNITQHMRDMQQIQDNQAVLLERERLASLGQLIGGIAHNLKTPIMSVAGGIDQLKYLAEEYVDSLDDKEVTQDDHKEIAAEMQDWLKKMKVHMGYMSDIISTVKDQAAKFTTRGEEWFTIDEAIKRVNILMHHEITKHRCKFTQEIAVDRHLRIGGDVNSMVQIMDNIIVNALQAYDGRGGEVVLNVTRQDELLQILIRDFGKGIDDKTKARLFKEMITTKGKHGTGLGLYMSYSTVKGMFRGDMWLESSVGKGTDFYIQLPIYEEKTAEGLDNA